MVNSMLKVGAGIALGGGIVLSALTFNGTETLNTARENIESYTAKAEQVVELYKGQGEELEKIKADIRDLRKNLDINNLFMFSDYDRYEKAKELIEKTKVLKK